MAEAGATTLREEGTHRVRFPPRIAPRARRRPLGRSGGSDGALRRDNRSKLTGEPHNAFDVAHYAGKK